MVKQAFERAISAFRIMQSELLTPLELGDRPGQSWANFEKILNFPISWTRKSRKLEKKCPKLSEITGNYEKTKIVANIWLNTFLIILRECSELVSHN